MWCNNLRFCHFLSLTPSFLLSFLSVFTLSFPCCLTSFFTLSYLACFLPSFSMHQCLLSRVQTEIHSVCDNWSTFQLHPDGLASNCLSRTAVHSHQQLLISPEWNLHSQHGEVGLKTGTKTEGFQCIVWYFRGTGGKYIWLNQVVILLDPIQLTLMMLFLSDFLWYYTAIVPLNM